MQLKCLITQFLCSIPNKFFSERVTISTAHHKNIKVFLFVFLLLCPETKALFAEFVDLTILECNFSRPPTNGQLAKSIDQPFLLDHGQVAFSTGTPVMIPHGSAHLLVVHLFASVQLHPAPRPGKLHRVAHLEDAVTVADPADDARVVVPVVQQVSDEDVERGQRNFGGVLSRTTPFTLDSSFHSDPLYSG